jgi:hypothetical protein
MTITYPYRYRNLILYEGDIGPGLKDQFSLVVVLKDSVTGESPMGNIAVSLEKSKKKPFKNLSGAFCFKGLADGSYWLSVESEYYLPRTEQVIIGDHQTGPNQRDIKVIALQLIPALTYPKSSGIALYVTVTDAENVLQKDIKIRCNILNPACYLKNEYDHLIASGDENREIMDKYKTILDSRICIYPETITESDRLKLGDIYGEIERRARKSMRGSIRLNYSDYANFLKKEICKNDILSNYESYPNNQVCFDPSKITDADRQIIPAGALTELSEMADASKNGKACFAHKKYVDFIKRHFLLNAILTKYEKDVNGRICLDLDEISQNDIETMPEHIKSLEKAAEVIAKTDSSGECILIFNGVKSSSEKIKVLAGKEEDPIYFDLQENTPNRLKISFP